jgi:putative N6-adenine-specific DNA methylase
VKVQTWTATTSPGLEAVVDRELRQFSVEGQLQPGAISFEASQAQALELALKARTPTRILQVIGRGPAHSGDQLMKLIRSLDWSGHLFRDSTVKLAVSFRESNIRHKQALERKVSRALREVQRGLKRHGRLKLTQRLQVRVVDNEAQLSLDAGGELLHRRGWRQDTGRAPMRENFAASLLVAAGWTGDEPLVDPFCGVGTIPIEATLIASGRSPHLGRAFAFLEWPGLVDAPALPTKPTAPTKAPALIIGSDKEQQAIERSQANASRAAVNIDWQVQDVAALGSPASTGLIVTNPPFGRRLGNDVGGVYAAFGRSLRAEFQGWRVLFLAPRLALAQKVHRRCERLTTFQMGGSRVGVYVLEL